MMAGSEDGIGGFKGLEAIAELCSHQDLDQVCVNSGGGSKFDCNRNGNVRDDLGGSYVFVSGVGEVSGCDLIEENCDAEFKDGVELKADSVVGVGIGQVVVGSGGNDRDYGVEENNSVSDKEVDLHAEFIGEVVENVTNGEVENGRPDFEAKVEDQVECEPGENLESRTDTGSEIGESGVAVIIAAGDGELLDKNGKDVEQNIVVSISELGESEQSDTVNLGEQLDTVDLGAAGCELAKFEPEMEEGKSLKQTEIKSVEGDLESQIRIIRSVDCMSHELEKDQNKFMQMKDLGSDEELRGSQEGVIKLAETGELFDKIVKAVEQELVALPAESKQSNTVAMGSDVYELAEIQAGIEVDVWEGKSEQIELNLVEQSLESQIRTTESVDCVPHDLEEGRYKFKHMKDLDSEIDGGVQLGNEIDAAAYKGIICMGGMAAADEYKVASDKELDECIHGSQSVDKLDLTPSNAATLSSIDKVPIECRGNITAGTDDGAAVEPEASRCVIVQGIGAVNLTELDSDVNQMYAESIGHIPAKICGSVLASINDGTVSDQGPVDADCGVGLVQGYEAERVVTQDTDGTLTTETATRSVTDQSKILQINPGEQVSGCTKSPELNGNPDDAYPDCIVSQVQSDEFLRSDCNGATILEQEVRNLVCTITDNKSELETKHLDREDVESGILSVTDVTKSETEVVNGLSSCAPNDVRSEMKIGFGTIDSAELVSKSWGNNSLSKSQVLDGDIECAWKQDILTTNSVESESCADMSFKSDVQHHSAINRSDMPGKDASVADSKVASGSAFLLECSIGDSVDGQSLGNGAKAKPFQFLVKFPRIDDDKLREQIRDAQLLVEEKTVLRNNIRCEIDIKRANLQSLGDEFEATKSDERAARRLVKLKRQEIDSVQDKINRVKNSISVMDITNRIAHMEHMIEHETRPLKEEMQLLREINIMKKLRGQISSNVCSAEEVTQALSQIEPTEMQLKTLKKELGDLKDKVSKAEAAVILLGKEYNDESKKLRELQARFRAANDIRQDAYKDLLGLKRQLHEKSKHYWIYKDDTKAASDYALNGDKEALYRLCAKQVETFMDLWNKNDEFREDYVRCNMKSTMRRLKTFDGRSLGPNEEVHVIPISVDEREVRQLYSPSRTTNPSSPTISKQENTVHPIEREPMDGKSLVVAEQKNKILKSKTESGLHIGSGQVEAEETKEEEKQQTKEELELATKAEMLRKEEIAAKLKEQLREEEKVKAHEALERKRRNADKAQMRAVLRAQKEAEQKEKEREKRLRKKEKKNTDGENGLELQTNYTKDESKDSPTTKLSKISHFNKYNKTKVTIPPALRNKGKRRLKQFMWWIFGGLIALFIFLVGSGGSFKNLRPRKDDGFLGNYRSEQSIWQS